MKIALVGGAGYIGHNLACALSKNDTYCHTVHVLDNLCWNNVVSNLYSDRSVERFLYRNFLDQRFDLMHKAGVELWNVDARNYTDLATMLDLLEPTDIVHMSAISSAASARHDPGLCFDLQLVTLRNVLEYAQSNKCRVTFMSSSTVYGDFKGSVVDESVRPQPKGIYANAKYMGERLVRTYSDSYGMDSIIIRPSALYGERCISGRVSQKFIEMALRGQALPLDGGGDGRLDFTHTSDLVQGIRLALEKAPKGTNTYNITYGNARTIKELADIVNEVVPCGGALMPRNDLAPVRGTLSVNRARKDLGFEPECPLEVGYKRYCQWYKEQWENAEEAYRRDSHAEQWNTYQNEAISA